MRNAGLPQSILNALFIVWFDFEKCTLFDNAQKRKMQRAQRNARVR
jgi:hypothetical protein